MKRIIDKETLVKLYVEQKQTDQQIADFLGCKKATIYKARKYFGIKALCRWERHECNPTQEQKQIIYGSLLGDASISNGIKGDYSCHSIFEVKHGPKQKDYLFWKYNQLKDVCHSSPKPTGNQQWRLRSFHHPYFSELRNKWYPNGIKTVNKQILEKLEPLGIAVWYMDDGSLSKQSNFIKLHTCSFTEKEHKLISLWLKHKFKINSHMAVYSGYRNLVIDLDSRVKFINMIKSHIVDSMKYKVTFREYNTWEN